MLVASEENQGKALEQYLPYGRGAAQYLVNCSQKHRFVYVETPKVACSTIKRVLQLIEVNGNKELVPDNVHDREASPLLRPLDQSLELHELFEGEKYFVFGFVRNPFARILSAYLDKVKNNEWERNRLLPGLGLSPEVPVTFREFLEAVKKQPESKRDIHWRSQSYILQPDRVSYSVIGRLENFAVGFEAVIRKISPESVRFIAKNSVDHHKTGAKKKVSEYIGETEKRLITSIYEEDFKRFCYSFDPDFSWC